MTVNFIAFLLAFGMLCGMFRCSSKIVLENDVIGGKPFRVGTVEYICRKTEKQQKVDEVLVQLRKLQ
jgi:hypothetical protein